MKAVHPHPIIKVLLSLLFTILISDKTVWRKDRKFSECTAFDYVVWGTAPGLGYYLFPMGVVFEQHDTIL